MALFLSSELFTGKVIQIPSPLIQVVVLTHLKNMLVKLDHETPRFGVKINK